MSDTDKTKAYVEDLTDQSDDFSRWIEGQFGHLPLVDAFRRIDFFFYGLEELRARLIGLLDQALAEDAA